MRFSDRFSLNNLICSSTARLAALLILTVSVLSFAATAMAQNDLSNGRRESADPYFTPARKNSQIRTVSYESTAENRFRPTNGARASVQPTLNRKAPEQDANTAASAKQPADRLAFATKVATPSNKSSSAGTSFKASHVMALVGGEPIFYGDMMLEANQILNKFMKNAPVDIKAKNLPVVLSQILPKYVDQKLLLVDTIRKLPEGAEFETIVDSAAKEFDEKAIDQFMKEFGVESRAMLDAQLRAQGSSLRKLRRSWSIDQLVRYFLTRQLQIDSEISHQEMLDTYRKDFDSYELKARARWQQVMVKYSKHSSRLEAKKAIVALGNEIIYSPSMQAIAKKGSDGFRAQDGGVHDWTTRNSLVLKELDKAIFSLPVGVLSEVIETKEGFHIIRVIERTIAGHTPFVEAQVEIRKKLSSEKRNAALQKHLTDLRLEIPVEIYDIPGLENQAAIAGPSK